MGSLRIGSFPTNTSSPCCSDHRSLQRIILGLSSLAINLSEGTMEASDNHALMTCVRYYVCTCALHVHLNIVQTVNVHIHVHCT